MPNYLNEAQEYADSVISENISHIVDCVFENEGILRNDLHRVADWHSLSWEASDGSSVNIYMDLTDAAEIIQQLREYDPQDSLWDHKDDPEEALKAKACCFFNNAVACLVQDALKKIEDLDFDDCKHDEWEQALEAVQDQNLDDLRACVERLEDLDGGDLDKEKIEAYIREELGL